MGTERDAGVKILPGSLEIYPYEVLISADEGQLFRATLEAPDTWLPGKWFLATEIVGQVQFENIELDELVLLPRQASGRPRRLQAGRKDRSASMEAIVSVVRQEGEDDHGSLFSEFIVLKMGIQKTLGSVDMGIRFSVLAPVDPAVFSSHGRASWAAKEMVSAVTSRGYVVH